MVSVEAGQDHCTNIKYNSITVRPSYNGPHLIRTANARKTHANYLSMWSSRILTSNVAMLQNIFMSKQKWGAPPSICQCSACSFVDWVAQDHSCLPSTACMRDAQEASQVLQFTLLLVEKAGVAPDVTLRFTACKQVRVQVREPLWLWNPCGGPHKVQNRSNQWPHKMNLGPTKNSWWGGMMGVMLGWKF